MKRLVIVAEMPDRAAEVLKYGNGALDSWVEEALWTTLEGDCGEEPWGKDVERLYGFRYTDARSAFNVVEARIEDTGEPDGVWICAELDGETMEKLEKLAKAEGVTPKQMVLRLLERDARRQGLK